MKINGSAIYNTRTVEHYKDGPVYFTKNKTGPVNYALVCLAENEALPSFVEWEKNIPKKGTKMMLLQTGASVKWTNENGHIKVYLPSSLLKSKSALPALAFSFITE